MNQKERKELRKKLETKAQNEIREHSRSAVAAFNAFGGAITALCHWSDLNRTQIKEIIKYGTTPSELEYRLYEGLDDRIDQLLEDEIERLEKEAEQAARDALIQRLGLTTEDINLITGNRRKEVQK